MEQLRGTNAILTGASRGIGVHVARALAGEGVNLALAARSADDLDRVRSEVTGMGVKAVSIPTDVSDRAQLESLVERATAELGPPDILVNNAGIEAPHAYQDYPPDEIEALITINLLAPMLLSRLVLPGMLERGRGHIVVMASLAGKGAFPYEVPYSASKAGLVKFVHTLRSELIDDPVSCSAVCPGFVSDEGMYQRFLEEAKLSAPKALGTSTPEKVAEAVIKAIRKDATELFVNPSPMRPITVFQEMFPDTGARILKLLGVTDFSRRATEARGGGRV